MTDFDDNLRRCKPKGFYALIAVIYTFTANMFLLSAQDGIMQTNVTADISGNVLTEMHT